MTESVRIKDDERLENNTFERGLSSTSSVSMNKIEALEEILNRQIIVMKYGDLTWGYKYRSLSLAHHEVFC